MASTVPKVGLASFCHFFDVFLRAPLFFRAWGQPGEVQFAAENSVAHATKLQTR
jgi:hypothetical protein